MNNAKVSMRLSNLAGNTWLLVPVRLLPDGFWGQIRKSR